MESEKDNSKDKKIDLLSPIQINKKTQKDRNSKFREKRLDISLFPLISKDKSVSNIKFEFKNHNAPSLKQQKPSYS